MTAVTYTGHHADGSGIQAHSAGPDYPAIIGAREFECQPDVLYWTVSLWGFDWGTFHTHADAQQCVRLIKAARAERNQPRNLMMPEPGWQARDALAKFLDDRRAARDGCIPPSAEWEAYPPVVLHGMPQMPLPVDTLTYPRAVRLKYGHRPEASRTLAAWGYDPNVF